MINCLIFTKNRAMQLDLLLRSIKDNFTNKLDIYILGKTTTKQYKKGYRRLLKKHKYLKFYEETPGDFRLQVLGIMDKFKYNYTLCFVDDDVVIRAVKATKGINLLDSDPAILAFSLRMGKHIDYCYAKDQSQPLPDFVDTHGLLKWNWTVQRHDIDWGYPISVAGNIYRAGWFHLLLQTNQFDSPNMIEGMMSANRPFDQPSNICYPNQRVYNVANNLVQTVCKNRFSIDHFYDTKYLNDLYLDGYIISTETLYNKKFNCANGECEFKFIKG